MTAFDYAVLGVLAGSLLLGLWRGLVSEVLALAAWVLAFFAARESAVTASALLANRLPDEGLRYAAAFASVFVAVLVVVGIVRLALRKLLAMAGLGVADRFLGGVFGVARALAIVFAFVLLGGMTAMPRQGWWREATLAPPLETAVLAAKPWLPQAVARRVRYR